MTTAFDQLIQYTRDDILEAADYARDHLNGMSDRRVREWLQDEGRERIDSMIPVYNNEIMDLAKDSRVWSQDTSDLGQPRDLIQAAQWAIFMALEEAIYDDDSLVTEIIERVTR